MNRLTATHRRRLAHAVLTPLAALAMAGAPGHAAANGADLTLNVDFTTWTLMGGAAAQRWSASSSARCRLAGPRKRSCTFSAG